MLDRLSERGFDGLDAAHTAVLQYPGPHGLRPSDLSARLCVSKQALNYLLGDLERSGYLERRPDPDDGRSRRIALTQRGRRAMRVMREAMRELERDWERELGRDDFARLRELLRRLNDAVAPASAPPRV